MDFYTIFEQGVITTRNCNRHTQGPLRLDLLLSESFSESDSTSMLVSYFRFTRVLGGTYPGLIHLCKKMGYREISAPGTSGSNVL